MFRSSRPDYIETQLVPSMQGAEKRNCSGLPDRTTLRPDFPVAFLGFVCELFRSSRPDYIETSCGVVCLSVGSADCSGLPDRTTLRLIGLFGYASDSIDCSGLPDRTTLRPPAQRPCKACTAATLFRSSRPDYIETPNHSTTLSHRSPNCSGLPDRTTLRLFCIPLP